MGDNTVDKGETCRMECRCRAFGLGGTKPILFVTPQGRWFGMPWTFMTYRLAIALYQLILVILTLVYWGEEPLYSPVDTKAKWLIFISNWTYLFTLTYFIIAVITTFYWHLRPEGGGEDQKSSAERNDNIEMNFSNQAADAESATQMADEQVYSTPWYLQIQRFFQVYSCSGTVFVTLLFWILVYNPDSTVVQVFNVHVHGVAMSLMIFDTIVVATPFRILHMVYVMLVAFIYFCFTAVYWAAGGRDPQGATFIYDGSLDWEVVPTRSAIIAALTVFVAAPVLHLFFCAIYRIRIAVGRCCHCCTHNDS